MLALGVQNLAVHVALKLLDHELHTENTPCKLSVKLQLLAVQCQPLGPGPRLADMTLSHNQSLSKSMSKIAGVKAVASQELQSELHSEL